MKNRKHIVSSKNLKLTSFAKPKYQISSHSLPKKKKKILKFPSISLIACAALKKYLKYQFL